MHWLSRLPIRLKAPATVAFLVLLVGGAISAAAYLALKRAMHDQAATRLLALQGQYRESYRNSIAASRTRASETAAHPALAAYLSAPTRVNEAAARTALRPRSPAPEGVVQTELRDRSGRVVLTIPGPAAKREAAFETFEGTDEQSLTELTASAPLGVGYGKLQRWGDVAVLPIVARVGNPASGFLVTWRTLTPSSQVSQEQIATVLGNDAAVYLTNADGSLWTELGKPVASAPSPPSFDEVREYERPGRGLVLSASGPIEGSPWAFVFEFPSAAVHAPADAFLRTIAWIAAVCILIGVLVALVMTRRLTEPLHRLTKAANAIASGELSTRAEVRRSDELGQLVASFNSMAAEVEASRSHLESVVEERTRKLRSAEESLLRSEKLALVGQYASSIGHEIRNPLAAMSNAVDGLQVFLVDKTPQVQQCLDILTRQVRLSAKVVTDMLDLSRTTVPERESVQIAACVSSVLQKHPSNGVAVTADIPADLPHVLVDPVHATQVIDNLVTNAIQAIDGAGTVCVRAHSNNGMVSVEVTDTGPGVSEENAARIFEPLFTTKLHGTGLGLALSKSLAHANGGDLTLASKAGEGARFVLTLPAAHSSVASAPPTEESSLSRR